VGLQRPERGLHQRFTLKRSPERSHTQGLANRSIAIMERNGVSVEVVRAVDHEIASGPALSFPPDFGTAPQCRFARHAAVALSDSLKGLDPPAATDAFTETWSVARRKLTSRPVR
jgi:hypothetical protein